MFLDSHRKPVSRVPSFCAERALPMTFLQGICNHLRVITAFTLTTRREPGDTARKVCKKNEPPDNRVKVTGPR